MADRTAADEFKVILDLLQSRGLQASRVRVGDIEVELSGPSQFPRASAADEPSGSPPTDEREQRRSETHGLLGVPRSIFRRTGGE